MGPTSPSPKAVGKVEAIWDRLGFPVSLEDASAAAVAGVLPPPPEPLGDLERIMAGIVVVAAHERGTEMAMMPGVSDDEWVDWCIMTADLIEELEVRP